MKTRLVFGFLIILFGCNSDEIRQPTKTNPTKTQIEPVKIELAKTPQFNSKSAYNYIKKQVDFGPRVPNSNEHKKCAKYLMNELVNLGLDTIVQRTTVTAFNGKDLTIFNIIGQYRPELKSRILLGAHWDSRPFADRDTKKIGMPIDAANDGASGVGVLLELANAINSDTLKPKIGFDIIFFDAEDYGQPNGTMLGQQAETWCLGSQYWAKNLHVVPYKPKYGIVLDMVGAQNAVFPKEGWSLYYAAEFTNNMWSVAQELGYENYFINQQMMNPITDDHLYVNSYANIPCIDVIHYEPKRMDFGSFHHTHNDNMEIIDETTLKAVGETVLQMIYREN